MLGIFVKHNKYESFLGYVVKLDFKYFKIIMLHNKVRVPEFRVARYFTKNKKNKIKAWEPSKIVIILQVSERNTVCMWYILGALEIIMISLIAYHDNYQR